MAINQIQTGDNVGDVRVNLNTTIDTNIEVDQFTSFLSEDINTSVRTAGVVSANDYSIGNSNDWSYNASEINRLANLGFNSFMVPADKTGNIGILQLDKVGFELQYPGTLTEITFTRPNTPEDSNESATGYIDANGEFQSLGLNQPRWTYPTGGQITVNDNRYLQFLYELENEADFFYTFPDNTNIIKIGEDIANGYNLPIYENLIRGQRDYRTVLSVTAGEPLKFVFYYNPVNITSGGRIEVLLSTESSNCSWDVTTAVPSFSGACIAATGEILENGWQKLTAVFQFVSDDPVVYFDFQPEGNTEVGEVFGMGGYQIYRDFDYDAPTAVVANTKELTRQADVGISVAESQTPGIFGSGSWSFRMQTIDIKLTANTSYWIFGLYDATSLTGYLRFSNSNGNLNFYDQRNSTTIGNVTPMGNLYEGAVWLCTYDNELDKYYIYVNNILLFEFNTPAGWSQINRIVIDPKSTAFGAGIRMELGIKQISLANKYLDTEGIEQASTFSSHAQMASDLGFTTF